MPRKGAFIHSNEIEQYHYPAACPFKTERAGLTRSILRSMSLYESNDTREVAPRRATNNELLLFHTPGYLDALRRASRSEFRPEDFFLGLGTADNPVFADLYPYAELAVGATITGAELLLNGSADFAFNPSGGYHHALPATAGGFCYINDMVIACKILRERYKRILCLDLDAHHCNGTQSAFYAEPEVLTVSFHESGRSLFPGTGFENEIGEGRGYGYNVNVPLPAGTDDEAFLFAFRNIVPSLLDSYKPEVIVLEIGMDVLSVDPLTHLNMTNNAIADTLPAIMEPGVPLLVTGGGGYNPEHTARGWALAWTILGGNEPETDWSIGMGGTFLGSSEWSAGLRDGRIYARGDEKNEIRNRVEHLVSTIRKTVFPLHGIIPQ